MMGSGQPPPEQARDVDESGGNGETNSTGTTVSGVAPPDARRATESLSAGDFVRDYVVRRPIASGGGGAVYVCEHRVLGRSAAIKVLHPEFGDSPEMIQRFVREARAVNQIQHPNIVDIYDFGMLPDGRPFYVMELLEGTSLHDYLRQHGALSPERAADLMEPICAALGAAHDAGFVHRDIKASNVFLLRPDTEQETVKLLDFGIAKLLYPDPSQPALTAAGRRIGTPHAMAPEQIHGGTITVQTDIYALGVLLFQLLTGRYPFIANEGSELERMHLHLPAPEPSQFAAVPPAVDAVVARCLQKPLAARYESTDALRRALREAVSTTANDVLAQRTGVAIHVELRLHAAQDQDAYGGLLDGLDDALEVAEDVLCDGGFTVPVLTGCALVAIMLLPADQHDALEQRHRALELAADLYDRIAAMVDELPVSAAVTAHCGTVVLRNQVPISGELLDLGAWAAWRGEGASATEAALLDVGESRLSPR